ncbi:MAG: hypothetical protein NTX50_10140, partial [Candidatus Sumerlaeota bacterium]|nr:hypothetical protein [Candidatus Sumerlaeota bacterium]
FGVRWLAAFFLAPRLLKRQKEGGKPPYSKSWRRSYLHESSLFALIFAKFLCDRIYEYDY